MRLTSNQTLLSFSLIISLLVMSQSALATNGYYTHGLGIKNKSMAGAGTASPDEAMAATVNPASAVLVKDAWEVGLSIFSPKRRYTASSSQAMGNGGAFTLSEGTLDSGSEYFPIPYFGRTWHLTDDSAVAFNFYGRGGMNTDYNGGSATLDPDGPGPAPVSTLPGVYGGGATGVDLMQAFMDVTYAHQMDNVSFGIGGVFAIQRFEANGLALFGGYTKSFAESGGTVMPTNLTNTGAETSTGFGLKVGTIINVSDAVTLAASYQTQIKMSELDAYADLFAEGGGFDIPSTLRVGFSIAASTALTLHADYELTGFNNVTSVGYPIENLFGCPTAGAGGTDLESCMGGNNGPGFGWDDVGTMKFGLSWQASPTLTLRAGYSKADQPIAANQVLLNIIAPAVIEQHFTVGLTRQLGNDREFSAMLMVAPSNRVSGASTFDPTQTIELEMDQLEVEFAYRF